MAVALLVLGVPIIDTFWIIVRRLLAGQSPFTADRGHLHHRLLDLGLGHREAVLVIYAICGVLAVLSLVLSGTGQLTAFVGVVVVLGAFLFVVTRRTTDALEASTYDEEEADPAPSREAGEVDTRADGRQMRAPRHHVGAVERAVQGGSGDFGASIEVRPRPRTLRVRPPVLTTTEGSWSRSNRS